MRAAWRWICERSETISLQICFPGALLYPLLWVVFVLPDRLGYGPLWHVGHAGGPDVPLRLPGGFVVFAAAAGVIAGITRLARQPARAALIGCGLLLLAAEVAHWVIATNWQWFCLDAARDTAGMAAGYWVVSRQRRRRDTS